MKQIFLNAADIPYDQTIVERLHTTLKTAGLKPWLRSKDVLAGQSFRRAIDVALGASQVFLAVISKESLVSGQHIKEQNAALELSLERIIVVWISDTNPTTFSTFAKRSPLGDMEPLMLKSAGWEKTVKEIIRRIKDGDQP